MDDRKLKILAAVVEEYIVTGDPVGSKTVMKSVKASSATIRNEMAELEKQGYLEQPHTSAGRIPTYNGFRIYIDQIMQVDPLTDEEKKHIDSLIPDNAVTDEQIVQSASMALSELTQCATVVAHSEPKFSLISKVEVIPTGKRMFVILMITSNGSIKNKTCRLEFDITNEQLEFFDNFLRENLQGMPLDEISDEFFDNIKTALGTYMMTLSPLVLEIMKLSKEFKEQDVDISGAKNLLACKDFNQNEIISFLDNKEEITKLINDTFSDLHVMFSPENDEFVIHNSSFISAPISRKGKNVGSLGLIGPMRLNYSKFIPYLKYFSNRITDLLDERDDEDEE
ncbi:MAG: heat-inducible transcriptional repressor HrcA [Oscillospiraceae bacterium]